MQCRVQAWRSAIGQELLEALQATINTAVGAMEQALAILAGAARTLLHDSVHLRHGRPY